jgi:hypothetical protein
MSTLKPIGHQHTNWNVRFVLMVATPSELRLHGTERSTPWPSMTRATDFTIMFTNSNSVFVISATDNWSWYAFSSLITRA